MDAAPSLHTRESGKQTCHLVCCRLCCRVEMGRCHFRELSVLLEFVNRPQETYRDDPAAFDAAATAAASLASVFFGVDSSTATSAGEEADTAGTKTAAAAAAAAGSVAPAEQQQPEGEADAVAAVAAAVDGSLPWDRDPMRLLCDALARTSMMCHLGLMHACMNFFYAGRLQVSRCLNAAGGCKQTRLADALQLDNLRESLQCWHPSTLAWLALSHACALQLWQRLVLLS